MAVFAGLDHEGRALAGLVTLDDPRAADFEGFFKLALNELAEFARVEMERAALSPFELLLVEEISVEGHLAHGVRNLFELKRRFKQLDLTLSALVF
jgi:hypothetical protein